MKRREFIALVGGAAGWSLTAQAQQTRVPRIGVLVIADTELMGPYREALRDLGYVEGKNIQIDIRSAEGQTDRLAWLAAELVREQVDIILAPQTPSIIAARNETRDIPIVMAPAGDPVAQGLIASLARPGGNLTGVSSNSGELAAKSLELIPEMVPGARRVGVLGNANDPFVTTFLEHIERGAKTARLEIRPTIVRSSDEIESAFATLVGQRVDAVIVQPSLPVKLTVELALKHRLPSVSLPKSDARAGRLASYGSSLTERGRQLAGYIDKILKGAKPADLPVQQPTQFEITINLKTAKALGLNISPMLLARADEVIE
jgi:putative ABC transport system substrate-binding protein